MNPFEYDGTHWRVADGALSMEMDAPTSGSFLLKPFPGLEIVPLEAVVGDYPESLGLAELRRPHQSEDGLEVSFESTSRIPFGTPSRIAHKRRLDASSLSVQTSFELPHAFALSNLSAGGLRFSGGIRRIGVLKAPNEEGPLGEMKWFDFNAFKDGESIYERAIPLLILVVETASGRAVRFEAGKDVWRWMNAAGIGGECAFSVVREDGALVFRWRLFGFLKTESQPEPPHGRNWNLFWSLHWSAPAAPEKPAATLDLEQLEEAESCAASSAALNAMKKWLRRQLQTAKEGDSFVVRFREPRFCMKAAHLDRARMGRLAHWDLPAVREFARWGNRQLTKQGASLALLLGDRP